MCPPSPLRASNRDRLIVALDVPTIAEAKDLVNTLASEVQFFKLGLELAMSNDYFAFIAWLKQQHKKVFADLKFYDIPQTVKRATAALAKHQVDLATIHGDDAIAQAAAQGKGSIKILAVTVLTSLEQADLIEMGIEMPLSDLIAKRAKSALKHGCDGVVASGQEAAMLRQLLGKDALIVTPGIRHSQTNTEDQKRTTTAEQAIHNGASHIVVGRPITRASDPRLSAQAIQTAIAQACA